VSLPTTLVEAVRYSSDPDVRQRFIADIGPGGTLPLFLGTARSAPLFEADCGFCSLATDFTGLPRAIEIAPLRPQ
jgi:hypothetical protein